MTKPDLHATAIGLATEAIFGASDMSVIEGLADVDPTARGKLAGLTRAYVAIAREHGPSALTEAGLAIARVECDATGKAH